MFVSSHIIYHNVNRFAIPNLLAREICKKININISANAEMIAKNAAEDLLEELKLEEIEAKSKTNDTKKKSKNNKKKK